MTLEDILEDLRGLFVEQEWMTPEHYRKARDHAWAHEAELLASGDLRKAVDTCLDPCDDGSCCEPPPPDAEEVARLRQVHFGE